ncbi:MAG: LysR family transcriptional regulator [Pseudomonadota bacterium]
MKLWTEMHTALLVGRTGTVRAAANQLGIHRATVSRHIETLEERLGTRLFIRHADGYTPTQIGYEMIRAAEQADDAIETFMDFLATNSDDLTGTLRISAVSRAGWLVRPAMKLFSQQYPGVTVRFEPSTEIPKLELGEAHIAVHAGKKPTHPDYVVLPFFEFPVGIFAHREYVSENGLPETASDLLHHRFIGAREVFEEFGVFSRYGNFLTDANLVLESNSPTIVFDSILAGMGLGVASIPEAKMQPDLIEVLPQRDPLTAPVWITTHVDVHRTRMVSGFISSIKAVKKPLMIEMGIISEPVAEQLEPPAIDFAIMKQA